VVTSCGDRFWAGDRQGVWCDNQSHAAISGMDLRFSGKVPGHRSGLGRANTMLSEACLHLLAVTLLINFEMIVKSKGGFGF
jgi:hypothetical protein